MIHDIKHIYVITTLQRRYHNVKKEITTLQKDVITTLQKDVITTLKKKSQRYKKTLSQRYKKDAITTL